MKRLKLSILVVAAVAMSSGQLLAQDHHHDKDGYAPSVYTSTSGDGHKHHADKAHKHAAKDYAETHRTGFQQNHIPQFIFTSADNRFSLALGGSVTLRTSYDFGGAVDNIDFVPYDIPMSNGYASKQRVMMDASTSRLYLKAVVHSERLGRVVVYTDMDFRGGSEFSYIPRLRSAYIQFKGLTIGRDVTTFCDLDAAPTTIDFQGPNAYNFAFNELIRYECNAVKNFSFVVAAERPSVNATYGENFSAVMQRVPDGIIYAQYKFGRDKNSHLRLSGVIRDMYLHNNLSGENTTQVGWGVQLSGHIGITRWVDVYMNGVYGKGITPYIQDLSGSPYDFAYNPSDRTKIETLPMWGWQAAAQVNIIPGTFWVAGGYSMVGLEHNDGYLSDNQYCRGEYLFANAFYNLTPNLTLAVEYLYGSRKDMNASSNSANRLNIMAQYHF